MRNKSGHQVEVLIKPDSLARDMPHLNVAALIVRIEPAERFSTRFDLASVFMSRERNEHRHLCKMPVCRSRY
jgi:hypothetical protein